MKARIATSLDVDGVLALQDLYLYARLNEEERKRGFVTTPFSRQQIEEIMDMDGLFIAEEDQEIIAYVYAGTWDYFDKWPIFPYMTSRFSSLKYKSYEISRSATFQYGPVCVHEKFRGKGTFNATFESMRLEWIKKFPLSLTFINAVNEVSEKAHLKLGWEVIDRFSFNDKNYLTLAYEMNKSVL